MMFKIPYSFILFFLVGTTVFFHHLAFSQKIEVTKGKLPFTDAVEWMDRGVILYGGDPSGKTQEINISYVNTEGETRWNKSIYPKAEPTHLILSPTSNYLYFVDDLRPEKNFIRYNQVGISGNVIPAKFDMLSIIRKYRYTTPDDLELKEIVNTPKALVFYFQLPVKSQKIVENFFVTITHHDNRVYHYKGSEFGMRELKNGTIGDYMFAGADTSSITFSHYSRMDGPHKQMFIQFSPKAKEMKTFKYVLANVEMGNPTTFHSAGLNGSYYIEKELNIQTTAPGHGIVFNNRFYYIVNEETCLAVYTHDDSSVLKMINTCDVVPSNSKKKNSDLTIANLGSKLFVFSDFNSTTSALSLSEGEVNPTPTSSKLEPQKLQNNPSSFHLYENTSKFVVNFKGKPYTLNSKKLGKMDSVVFEAIK